MPSHPEPRLTPAAQREHDRFINAVKASIQVAEAYGAVDYPTDTQMLDFLQELVGDQGRFIEINISGTSTDYIGHRAYNFRARLADLMRSVKQDAKDEVEIVMPYRSELPHGTKF